MARLKEEVHAEVEAALANLRRIKDIRGLAVVRRDGLAIAHDLPDARAVEKVAAMSAAMVGTGEMASEELARGEFLRTLIEAERGRFLTVGAGETALLVGLLRKECNLGLVLAAVEQTARELSELLTREVIPVGTP